MADTRFYFDFHYPLKVVQMILEQLFGRGGKNPETAQTVHLREWFSQPRAGTDTSVETITTTFKLPLSVSEISMEILRMPCTVEVWYQDRSNNWRPVLDMTRLPVRINVARSDTKSFYKLVTKVYPIVAKQLQFRLVRINDITMEGAPYVVGLRNTLIRRNVYDRAQGTQYFEEEQDVLGNVVTKYIKDWDATRAADDDPYTFWKSEPMPDPGAVVSLYLDLRATDGGPKTIDKIYIDPVYTGQMLNLYYSNDDTRNTLKLNPVSVRPDEDQNTSWRIGRGRTDISPPLEDSYYRWRMALGPQIRQDTWIGIEWTPDFAPGAGPPQNPVLYRTIDPGGQWKTTVEYDVGAGHFTLRFDDGTDTREYSAPMTKAFTPGDPLRIVVGWTYGPDMTYISVLDRRGEEVARVHEAAPTLPQTVSFDGTHEMFNFRGLVTALILKFESHAVNSASFQTSPTYYVDPDPVIPDASGVVPSTTLDNAFYAVSWTTQEHGSGGSHVTAYEDKEWTPVYRDYVSEKGMLFLPQATSMKYLKLEFTNLTEQPYPIYESGVQTRYRVYPLSVLQQASVGPRMYTGRGGFLGLGTFISMNGVRSVNWLNPASVINAVSSVVNTNWNPVMITQNSGYTSETLPNQGNAITNVAESHRLEVGSSYVYRREALQPYILAETAYVTTIKAEGLQKLQPYTDVPWEDIEAANPGAITHVKGLGALPIRGTDWWIYPGQTLKVPANIMTKLTGGNVVRERRLTREHRIRFQTTSIHRYDYKTVTREHRIRFQTTSIHRYDYKTVTRDAALAYFAGVREVIPFTSTFIAGEDKPYFDFPTYDSDQFVLTHTRPIIDSAGNPVGPITTQKRLYEIDNRLFERNLNNWITDGTAAWTWDGDAGRWLRGTARCAADGQPHTLLSVSNQVTEGEEAHFKVSIKWSDLEVVAGQPAIRWGVRFYNGNDLVSESAITEITDPLATEDWADYQNDRTVPAGVTSFRVFLQVTGAVSAGTVWFESVNVTSNDLTNATAFKSLQTLSTFAKVAVDFKDSGLRRSDSMWADINPDSESISDTALAYYTRTVPEEMPGGTWSDTIKGWGAEDAEWGSPFQIVSVSVDANRRYQGKRVLHFRRAAGAGEAGIKVKQWNHFVPQALFRIGAEFRKEIANNNQITVRLRRLADGVIVYEETVEAPSGRWVEFQTKFTEVPAGLDQEYEVMLTLEGDDEDELYLSDLYTEVALVRYFVRLGGIGSYLHEVTDLRYRDGRVNVTTTTPVNDMSLQAAILSPEAFAYGARVTPTYLK